MASGPTNGNSVRIQQGASNGMTRAPSYRRPESLSTSQPVMDHQDGPTYLPAAPEAPRAPPSSYRDSVTTAYDNHEDRSFSARMQYLPPERRYALSGETSSDDFDDYGIQQSFPDSRRYMPRRSYTTTSYRNGSSKSITLASSIRPQHTRRASETVPTIDSSSQISPISRSSTMRSSNSQRHNKAPDRSPLQQLEMALQGITKEEKRAKVQEAEMRLKEQIARRERARGGSGQDDSPTPLPKSDSRRSSKAEPSTAEVARLVRNLSTRQRDMLQQHSASTEAKQPESRRFSAGGRGDDYQEPQDAVKVTVTIGKPPSRDVQSTAVQPAKEPQHATAENYNQQIARDGRDAERQVKVYHSRAQSVDEPPNRRPLPVPNASHRVLMSDPYVPKTDETIIGRANSKRLQKEPPRAYRYERRTEWGNPRNIQREQFEHGGYGSGAMGAGPQYQEGEISPGPSAAETSPAPIGLGLTQDQGSVQQQSINRDSQPNADRPSKPKKQTVSFDMPPPTPPPLTEWKQAPVARLRAADLEFRDFDADKGQSWWASGGTKNRRQSRALPSDYQQKQVPKIKCKSFSHVSIYTIMSA